LGRGVRGVIGGEQSKDQGTKATTTQKKKRRGEEREEDQGNIELKLMERREKDRVV
jgi:hypothetical protein